MKKNPALVVAGLVFLFVAFCHGYRVYSNFDLVVASYTVPQYFSYIGGIVALILALWMFIAAAKR